MDSHLSPARKNSQSNLSRGRAAGIAGGKGEEEGGMGLGNGSTNVPHKDKSKATSSAASPELNDRPGDLARNQAAAQSASSEDASSSMTFPFNLAYSTAASPLELVDVTSIGPGDGGATGRWTRVRVDNVHPESHIAGIPATLATAAGSPRKAHGGLAAAVVEELDIRAAEVPIPAVDDGVYAGFGQREPGQVIEHAGTNRDERVDAHRQAERQPETGEHEAAQHVRLGELVVPREGDRRLVRAAHHVTHVHHQLDVEDEYYQNRQADQHARANRLLHRDAVDPATEVEAKIELRL